MVSTIISEIPGAEMAKDVYDNIKYVADNAETKKVKIRITAKQANELKITAPEMYKKTEESFVVDEKSHITDEELLKLKTNFYELTSPPDTNLGKELSKKVVGSMIEDLMDEKGPIIKTLPENPFRMGNNAQPKMPRGKGNNALPKNASPKMPESKGNNALPKNASPKMPGGKGNNALPKMSGAKRPPKIGKN